MLDPGAPLRKDSFRTCPDEGRGAGRIPDAPKILEARPSQQGEGQGHRERRISQERSREGDPLAQGFGAPENEGSFNRLLRFRFLTGAALRFR